MIAKLAGIFARSPDTTPYEVIFLSLGTLFILINALALTLARVGTITLSHLWVPALWLSMTMGGFILLTYYAPQHDPFLYPLLSFLLGWGILLINRLAPAFIGRHIIWFILGMIILVGIMIVPIDWQILSAYRYTCFTVGLLLLGATLLFGVNPSGFGARLWLKIPFISGIYFQPSELLKFLLVIFLASYFEGHEPFLQASTSPAGILRTLPYLAPILLMWGFSMLLLVLQQDLGAAILFFLVFLALLYLASGEKLYLLFGGILLLCAGIVAYQRFSLVQLRLETWWNPWPEATDRAYQIVQSLYALAAGGLGGQGIYQGFPEYIPVVHSDFVFAAVAEEWGLIGSTGLVLCFALLTYRGFRIALLSSNSFYFYLSAGISLFFGIQALLIMGGVTKLLPLTGVTLPFVSYGGSSLLISCLMAGILLYISAHHSRLLP